MSKVWGLKWRERNLKVLLELQRIGRKGLRYQIIPSRIILLQLHGAVPATKPSSAMAAEHCSFGTEILNNLRICVYDRSDFIRLIVLTIST